MRKLDHTKASFDALVDLLVESGNDIVGSRWWCNKEGMHTVLKHPIDWALVYASFSFDPDCVMIYENAIATFPEAYEVLYQPQR